MRKLMKPKVKVRIADLVYDTGGALICGFFYGVFTKIKHINQEEVV